LIDPETDRVLGVGIVRRGRGRTDRRSDAGDGNGRDGEDIALTVHAHPTLSETLMECAEAFYGHATHTSHRPDHSLPAY
jgi:dihydrolipoamide dehydrogenase